MAIEDINNRPTPSSPKQDPELAPSSQQTTEVEVKTTFQSLKSHMEDMLQFNYNVVQELLGQIAAVSPHRLDMVQGKQPEVASIEASQDTNATPVAPVGKASAKAYEAGLQHIDNQMGEHDMKLQQMYDMLALSRSGRKEDPHNHGLEFDQLKSVMNQAESRMYQMQSTLPETLPDTSAPLREMLPEFVDKLQQYDGSFRQARGMVRQEINSTKPAG